MIPMNSAVIVLSVITTLPPSELGLTHLRRHRKIIDPLRQSRCVR